MQMADILGTLVLGGMMGLIGQGARSVIGLKKLNDENLARGPNEQDLFIASRLLVSLFIGFIAGVAATMALGPEQLVGTGTLDLTVLLGIAAAGYVGTDAIEAFVARVGGVAPAAVAPPQPAPPPAPTPPPAPNTGGTPQDAHATAALQASISGIQSEVASLKTLIVPSIPLAEASLSDEPAASDGSVTPELIKKMFVPGTPLANIKTHLPNVIAGLQAKGLADRNMLLMALSTIRAESEGFAPISEYKSIYNTAKTPFDKYDAGTPKGKDLGNTQPGDGPKFKGRGFVQLTGRDNYTRVGKQLGLGLVVNPDLANDSVNAGLILAQFLLNHAKSIRDALENGDLKEARRLVNGGSHGFDRFKDAFEKGEKLLPEEGLFT